MENASKALIMAAGILIAIIIIGALTLTTRSVRSFQRANLSEEERVQIMEYNERFTKYVGQYMYGTEIMTMINKQSDDIKNQSTIYPITVVINFLEGGYTYDEERKYRDGTTRTETVTVNELVLTIDAATGAYIPLTSSSVKSFRNRAFKCKSVEVDNYTGRVNKIEFDEIKWK